MPDETAIILPTGPAVKDEGDPKMPVTTIPPGGNLRLAFAVPSNRVFEYHVAADTAVNTYVLDSDEWDRFRRDDYESFQSYGGFRRRREHKEEIHLPSRGRYYLVIENPTHHIVSVFYEVYF